MSALDAHTYFLQEHAEAIDQLKTAVTALESRVGQLEGMLRPTEVSAKENDWGVKLEKKTL